MDMKIIAHSNKILAVFHATDIQGVVYPLRCEKVVVVEFSIKET